MKSYNYSTRRFIDTTTGLNINDKERSEVKFFKEELDALITSNEFIEAFKKYVNDIAMYKSVDGRKYMRQMDYASVGVLDRNDVVQEAYLAFLEAYRKYKEKPDGDFENGAAVWGYLKKSTALNLERQIRNAKDGIRIPENALFESKSVNTNFLTKLFGSLEVAFANNEDEVSMTPYDSDLVGAFLEVHMDEYLDMTRGGNRDLFKRERETLKALYGIDRPSMTYAELEEYQKIPQPTIRQVKKRALKRLQSEESKREIASFLYEYRIKTSADVEKYQK